MPKSRQAANPMFSGFNSRTNKPIDTTNSDGRLLYDGNGVANPYGKNPNDN